MAETFWLRTCMGKYNVESLLRGMGRGCTWVQAVSSHQWARVPLKVSSLCTVSQLLGVYAGSLLQWSMQAGVLGSVPPVGVSWWAGATTLNWHCPLGSPCSSEGWIITHSQRLLHEASGQWSAVTRHLWRQTVQLQSCVPTVVTSWRYEAWRLVSVHYGTAIRRSLALLHVTNP
jgi:hypothetical protein